MQIGSNLNVAMFPLGVILTDFQGNVYSGCSVAFHADISENASAFVQWLGL